MVRVQALWLGLALGSGASAWAGQPGTATGVADGEKTWDTRVSVSEEYRFRSASESPAPAGPSQAALSPQQQDQDLRLLLQGDSTDPSGRYRLSADMGAWWDIDGIADQGEVQGLRGMMDTRRLWWDVFTLNGQYQGQGWLREVKLGRQEAEHGVPVVFDGLSTRVAAVARRVDLFVFGGRSVHFFSIANRPWEDWMASLGTALRLNDALRMEIDYRFLREDVELFGNVKHEAIIDHTYGWTGWWRPTEWLWTRAEARGVDDKLSLLSSSVRLDHRPWMAGANLFVGFQPMTLAEMNQLDNPYFSVLGESLAHMRWTLDLFKQLSLRSALLGFHLGWAGRMRLAGEEAVFNHNQARVYGLIEGSDLIWKGFSAGISCDDFYSPTRGAFAQDSFLAVGGFVRYEQARIRFEVATSFQRYRYVYYRDVSELSDVRTVSGEFGVKLLSWVDLKLRYEFERFDRDVHTLTVALTQSH